MERVMTEHRALAAASPWVELIAPTEDWDAADPAHEDAGALPQAQAQISQVGHAIGRQLEHERMVAALDPDALEDPRDRHRRHQIGRAHV